MIEHPRDGDLGGGAPAHGPDDVGRGQRGHEAVGVLRAALLV